MLTILGLYRPATLADHTSNAIAFPSSRILRAIHGHTPTNAAETPPQTTLVEIHRAAQLELPGQCTLHRRMLFRYTLTWRKPPLETSKLSRGGHV